MPIPDYQTIMLPLLKFVADGKEHLIKEAIEKLADEFGLTQDEKDKLLPSGQQTYFHNRVGWARTYLYKAKLVDVPKRGLVIVTERGKKVLESGAKRIDGELLNQFPEFVEFKKSKKETVTESDSQGIGTPEEILETTYENLRSKLADDLLVDLTPLDRQLEKPVSSREGDLAWLQTRNVRCMIDNLKSML